MDPKMKLRIVSGLTWLVVSISMLFIGWDNYTLRQEREEARHAAVVLLMQLKLCVQANNPQIGVSNR